MTVQIIRGNALHLPLADATVDLVCTSPPYFGLRSYQDGGQHYEGQLGSEATPAEFVAALLAATREMMRVTKPTGSIWINLGDKYSGHTGGLRTPLPHGNANGPPAEKHTTLGQPKSLLGIPWRYALACIDQLGLILRAEIIWNKPNGLPESVTDRVRRSHEQWFHLVKQPRYFSAVDEIREGSTDSNSSRHRAVNNWVAAGALGGDKSPYEYAPRMDGAGYVRGVPGVGTTMRPGLLGKLPGSVWTIPTEPLTVPDHLGVSG